MFYLLDGCVSPTAYLLGLANKKNNETWEPLNKFELVSDLFRDSLNPGPEKRRWI